MTTHYLDYPKISHDKTMRMRRTNNNLSGHKILRKIMNQVIIEFDNII